MKTINRLIILAAILLSGCATQFRCFELFPPDTITKVETHTVTQWKDTTVLVHIPGDSVFVYIPLPPENMPWQDFVQFRNDEENISLLRELRV